MARKRHNRTPHTITLRAQIGRGFKIVPINSATHTDKARATEIATTIAGFYEERLAEKDKHISELKEHISELKDRLSTTPRPPMGADEPDTSTKSDYYREILKERETRIINLQGHIIELKEQISELRDRQNTTPRPDLDADEVETSTHPRQ